MPATATSTSPVSTKPASPLSAGEKLQRARSEIRPLTALRFFPAFAVVVYHASEYFSCWHGLGNYYVVGQAVTFFFILSGFVLTLNYFHLQDFQGTCKFYLARFSRIWPAHAASLALLLLLIPEVFRVRGDAWPLFLSNLFMCHSWIPSWRAFFSYNAPSWSNATEMFFYLAFPLLLWSMRKKWYSPLLFGFSIVAALICICNSLNLPEFDPVKLSNQGLIYISPLSRLSEFCVGMVSALFYMKYLQKVNLKPATATFVETAIIVAVCALNLNSSALRYACRPYLGEAGAYWLQNSGPSVLGFALLILVFALEKGLISKILSQPVLVLLGELSFGVYMLHGVFITYLGLNFPQAQSLNMCMAFLAASFLAAHLMSELLEKPARKILMQSGNFLIGKFSSNKTRSTPEQKPQLTVGESKKKVSPGKTLLLGVEAIALVLLVYFNLPTIQIVKPDETASLKEISPVNEVRLAPSLLCNSAEARWQDQSVKLAISWQALRKEKINFSVNASVLDINGNVLAAQTYVQDGRQSQVEAGTSWFESCRIPLTAAAKPVSVAVSVSRNKKERLQVTGDSSSKFAHTFRSTAQLPPPDEFFLVPLSGISVGTTQKEKLIN